MTTPSRQPAIVTTSWDDGHRLDVRLAEMLVENHLLGTFYVAPLSAEIAPRDRLSRSAIELLSDQFEIGAHTVTHRRLTTLGEAVAREEIVGGRYYLEDVTGNPVDSFCYPGGAFGPEHVRLVRDAGFTYARTIRRFALNSGTDPLLSPTTAHAYRHLVDGGACLTYAKFNPMLAWDLYRHWDRLAMILFDQVLKEGGIFHLWGHSWEVDRNDQWNELLRVCQYIADHPGVQYVVNGDVPTFSGSMS
jgi:peptidoglycan/xylan/chitin deacetylase (PgdA/CDA1 family)